MIREPISVALFSKLAAVPGFVTTSRILEHFEDVPAVNQPAMFLTPAAQSPIRTRGLPPKWQCEYIATIYLHRASSDVPDTALNAILDAIEVALAPTPAAETQTLGGLVEHCWLEGNIEIGLGSLGQQLICNVPIKVLVAA